MVSLYEMFFYFFFFANENINSHSGSTINPPTFRKYVISNRSFKLFNITFHTPLNHFIGHACVYLHSSLVYVLVNFLRSLMVVIITDEVLFYSRSDPQKVKVMSAIALSLFDELCPRVDQLIDDIIVITTFCTN